MLLLITFLQPSPKNDAVLGWSLEMNQAEVKVKEQNAAAIFLLLLLASHLREELEELVRLHGIVFFIILLQFNFYTYLKK
ncbi:hypothetical protein IscW_ISCW005861 [Ixodes scapularis]|uniref:Uncharacterized protein n=1 Tax=Ixodes scapularis TaxID=6945 RepID=B7PMN4_IXOSC|nr:hypothetical protein IscW_ISCW005861 [Ixodes scapularis]|eukprot:XP_002435032.1 hypothetical protein IscW_ISCW005861 [Ixodes scapularis]